MKNTTNKANFNKIKKLEVTIEEKIFNMMTTHYFEKWYKDDFIEFIMGSEPAKPKVELLKDIKKMLN